jgi:predicted GIY-YIG superfamily endonuclease
MQQQQQPHGNRIDAKGQVSMYKKFLDMNPPQFTATKEPLNADSWIWAIEAMFTVFTLPCSEGRKAKFTTLKLRGSTLIWWEHYKSIQQPEYEITWEEFKRAFRDHHIPKALTDRKMGELLALKKGSDTVYQYAQKFNNLCHYGGYHVDTDMKKMELFREGLNSKLSERMNLVKFDSFPLLVNKAISQEDAMKRAQAERKERLTPCPIMRSFARYASCGRHSQSSSRLHSRNG